MNHLILDQHEREHSVILLDAFCELDCIFLCVFLVDFDMNLPCIARRTIKLAYSRGELLSFSSIPGRLSAEKWRVLCHLGLLTPQYRPTRRGCRAGALKQRRIKTVVSRRPAILPRRSDRICRDNLRSIPAASSHHRGIDQHIKVSLFNSRSVKNKPCRGHCRLSC